MLGCLRSALINRNDYWAGCCWHFRPTGAYNSFLECPGGELQGKEKEQRMKFLVDLVMWAFYHGELQILLKIVFLTGNEAGSSSMENVLGGRPACNRGFPTLYGSSDGLWIQAEFLLFYHDRVERHSTRCYLHGSMITSPDEGEADGFKGSYQKNCFLWNCWMVGSVAQQLVVDSRRPALSQRSPGDVCDGSNDILLCDYLSAICMLGMRRAPFFRRFLEEAGTRINKS